MNFSMPKTMSIEYNVQTNNWTNLRDRRQRLKDIKGLTEKLKDKAKWHQHQKLVVIRLVLVYQICYLPVLAFFGMLEVHWQF